MTYTGSIWEAYIAKVRKLLEKGKTAEEISRELDTQLVLVQAVQNSKIYTIRELQSKLEKKV
jgi:hypothetical protein